MKHLFVSYEIAKQLKEKEFCIYKKDRMPPPDNEKCFGRYTNNRVLYIGEPIINANLGSGVVAPLYQQVVDWFREKHSIHIDLLSPVLNSTKWYFILYNIGETRAIINDHKPHDSYYEALDKAIEEALKLIK